MHATEFLTFLVPTTCTEFLLILLEELTISTWGRSLTVFSWDVSVRLQQENFYWKRTSRVTVSSVLFQWTSVFFCNILALFFFVHILIKLLVDVMFWCNASNVFYTLGRVFNKSWVEAKVLENLLKFKNNQAKPKNYIFL